MTKTDNLDLELVEPTDFYDETVNNRNFSKIDQAIAAISSIIKAETRIINFIVAPKDKKTYRVDFKKKFSKTPCVFINPVESSSTEVFTKIESIDKDGFSVRIKNPSDMTIMVDLNCIAFEINA